MTAEIVSLYEEESARILGVLDVDGYKERVDVKNTHAYIYTVPFLVCILALSFFLLRCLPCFLSQCNWVAGVRILCRSYPVRCHGIALSTLLTAFRPFCYAGLFFEVANRDFFAFKLLVFAP